MPVPVWRGLGFIFSEIDNKQHRILRKKGGQLAFIEGGFYLKARSIQHSKIINCAPCVREIWDYLLMVANHTDNAVCKRGQHITTLNNIREALCWYAGWRKMMYKKHSCENAVKVLRAAGMITTTKTTRGLVITICNYDTYQNPSNYENRKGDSRKATGVPKHAGTINKNEKNEKNEKNNNITSKKVHEVCDELKTYEYLFRNVSPKTQKKFIDQYHLEYILQQVDKAEIWLEDEPRKKFNGRFFSGWLERGYDEWLRKNNRFNKKAEDKLRIPLMTDEEFPWPDLLD